MSSWYQPQEEVQWWYEKGQKSATMISGARTDFQTFNMANPRASDGRYYGKWDPDERGGRFAFQR